jgi:hypothetical protein
MMMSHHKGVDDTHSKVGKKEIRKEATWFKIMFGSVVPSRSHHKEDSMVGCKIMRRCIAFGSPIVNLYAQSISITSEQEKSDNDVTSVLTASSS